MTKISYSFYKFKYFELFHNIKLRRSKIWDLVIAMQCRNA